jgi:hypothetical protein
MRRNHHARNHIRRAARPRNLALALLVQYPMPWLSLGPNTIGLATYRLDLAVGDA